jgi:2-methylcitrate dehydratase PrpD
MSDGLNRRQFFVATAAFGTLRSYQSNSQQQGQPAGSFMPALCKFTAGVHYDSIPPKALATARTAIIDCLGVAVAGSKEDSAQIIGKMVREEAAKEEATAYGMRFKSSVVQAAFVNGTSAHADDFDHSFVVGGQPSASIIPAVLTLGESLGAGGKQIIEAYVAGFEVMAALMFVVQSAGGGGWHSNGTIGTFGAAAACSKLLGLSEAQIEMALGIAASMASGVTSNFGTMTKPLHVGQAARNGILAARLAKAGFTANAQTLEARTGFFDCYYPGGKLDHTPVETLGTTYSLEKNGIRIKPYPCGGLTHSAIYATIRLRDEQHVTSSQVEHIDVFVPADTAAPLVYRVPKTALEGKFSMPYLIARALIDGNVTLDTFTDEAVRNKEVLQLLDKVEMKVDPKLQFTPDGNRPAIITVKLNNGQTQTLDQKFAKGSVQLPMTQEELASKFRLCTRGVLSAANTERALAYIAKLETMSNIRPLSRLLAGG